MKVQRVKYIQKPPNYHPFKKPRHNQPDAFERIIRSRTVQDRCAQFDQNPRYIRMEEDIALNILEHEKIPSIEHSCALVIHPVC